LISYLVKENKKVVFTEDFDNEEILNKRLKMLQNLGINQDVSEKELLDIITISKILIKYSQITFIILTSIRQATEFVQFFDDDEIKDKLVLFIPIKYKDEPSYLAGQIKRFILQRGHVFYFENIDQIIDWSKNLLVFYKNIRPPLSIMQMNSNKERIFEEFIH